MSVDRVRPEDIFSLRVFRILTLARAKSVFGVEKLEAVADRGYYSGEEILARDKAGIAVTLPKPMT